MSASLPERLASVQLPAGGMAESMFSDDFVASRAAELLSRRMSDAPMADSPSRHASGHGPWIDIHAHPGRCFLGGLPPSSPFVAMLGADESAARVQSSAEGEVSVVNASTVGDLAVLGVRPDGGLYASRPFETGEAAADHARQIQALDGLLSERSVRAVLGPDDISALAEQGEVGVFTSCEGGDFLDGALDGVAEAHADGIRAVTLVHYRVNELGDIQTEDAVHDGLTGFGREVVREMNRLGMIVDLAHATFATTVAALSESSRPIMISHSHLAGPESTHPRLLSEEHACVVAEAGGLIGAWPAGIELTTLSEYCEEICRLVDVVGIDHVAIGTDLDANYLPVLTDYRQFPEVAAELVERGMSRLEIDQVLGGNFVALFAAVTGS
jgi:membrane dipeptidase